MTPAKKLMTLFLSAFLFTTGYAHPLDTAKLNRFFNRLAEKNKAMGSLTIAKDGKLLYSRSIGYSQIKEGEKTPISPATRFRIGSVTKMFTATLIFQLIENGKLSLEDKLDQFFPQVPNADKITVEELLAHRSGVQDVLEIGAFRAHRRQPITKEELLAILATGKPDFEPGTQYRYSNSNYILLGLIVEKQTGRSYADVLKANITSQTGLQNTYVGTGATDPTKNESLSYTFLQDWKEVPETHISLLFGAGSLLSTPADLVQFIQALFNGRLVSPQSLQLMMQKKLGMETFTYNGKTFYGHTGGIDNFGSWLVYQPEEKLALAYSANAKVYPVAKIIDGVFAIYGNKPFTLPTFETVAISPDVLDQYTGVYSRPGAPVKFTVSRDGEALLIQMNGQPAVPLEATAPDQFKIERAGIVIKFDVGNKQMIFIRDGRERVLNKEDNPS